MAHSPERPWRDTSALIAVRSYSYWDDARSYEASREQLTAEQLALLDGLRAFAKPPSRVIAEDLTSHEVQIRDQDGTVAVYGASPTTPHLDGATLAPFLATFNCLSLFDTLRPFDPGVDGALPDAGVMADPAEAPLVSTADVGCLHAVPSCGEVRLRLAVERAGAYRLSTEGCPTALELHADSPSGAPLAAQSGSPGACPALTLTFETSGVYPLSLRAPETAECSSRPESLVLRVLPAASDENAGHDAGANPGDEPAQ